MNEDPLINERGFIPRGILEQAQKVRSSMAESMENFEARNRVGAGTIMLMLSVAGLYDLAQSALNFIPILGWIWSSIIGIYSWLTFYVWTSTKGWDFGDTAVKSALKNTLKLAARYGFPVLELIPILNDIPAITLGVICTILIIKSDDFIYNATKGRVDAEVISEGIKFFSLFRDVTVDTNAFSRVIERPSRRVNNKSGTKSRQNGNLQDERDLEISNGKSKSTDENAALSPNEIDSLKNSINRYKAEIQQLETQLRIKEEKLRAHDDLANEIIRSAKQNEGDDGNRARELHNAHRKGRAILADEVISLHRQINRNKDLIFSMNNKLMRLDRKIAA